MNATTQTKQIKAVKKVSMPSIEVLQQQITQLNLALNKSKSALKKRVSKTLRSETTKTSNSYHFSMSEFKDNIFKNKELFKDYIVSDDDNELIVKAGFKEFYMNRIREALNDLDNKA